MIEVFCYAVISVLLMVSMSCILLTAYRKNKKKKYLYFTLLIVALPGLPYLVVETQTSLFKGELTAPAKQTLKAYQDSQTIVTFKVLDMSPHYADVYVVVPCKLSEELNQPRKYVAYVLPLEKKSGRWMSLTDKAVMQDAVWSDCGSADGNIFPPYADKYDYN